MGTTVASILIYRVMFRNSPGKRKLCIDEVVLDDRQMEKQRNGKRRHVELW